MPRPTEDANVKDERSNRLRERLAALSCASETRDAAAGLTTLSLVSRSHAARHVWIDTDLGGHTSLDLEDRSVEGEWDNTLKTFKDLDDDAIVAIVDRWLSGDPLSTIDPRG